MRNIKLQTNIIWRAGNMLQAALLRYISSVSENLARIWCQILDLAGGGNPQHARAKYEIAKFEISPAGHSQAMTLPNIKLRQLKD